MEKQELIKRLREIGVVIRKPVVLRSGKTADFYCDIKKAYGYPNILGAFADHVGRGLADDITCIVGSGYGGIPLATAVSLCYGKKLVLVRDKIKDHGTKVRFEGYVPGKSDRLLIVDDVLTTGSSVRETLEALKDTSAEVAKVVVLVKRVEPDLPMPVQHIFTIDELF